MPEHVWHHKKYLPRMYASHRCFDPAKDVLLPPFTSMGELARSVHLAPAEERARTRDILFHWRGQVLWKLPQYSMGIRHQLVTLFRGMEREGVVVSHEHSPGFLAEMRRSTFCGVCPGNGWGHLETPVLLGCIPVVFMDDILTPWEGVLDFSSFGVRVPRRRLPHCGVTNFG